MEAKSEIKQAQIEVVVTRGPDSAYGPPGQVEDLGVVSYWHRNPLKRLLWKLRKR